MISVTGATMGLLICLGIVLGLFLGAWMLGHALSPLTAIGAMLVAFCLGVNVGLGRHE